jgi:hypothetical protein
MWKQLGFGCNREGDRSRYFVTDRRIFEKYFPTRDWIVGYLCSCFAVKTIRFGSHNKTHFSFIEGLTDCVLIWYTAFTICKPVLIPRLNGEAGKYQTERNRKVDNACRESGVHQ